MSRKIKGSGKGKKKIAAGILSLMLVGVGIMGCSFGSETPSANGDTENGQESVEVRISALKGPTAMGLVKLMKDAQEKNIGKESYTCSILASPEEVTPKIVQGSLDIASVPANLASVLYNQTDGAIQVLMVNTLGVLNIVENGDTIHSVADLKGKTIYASGKGSTPEYALNYILEQNGLVPGNDVIIEWKSEHSECVAAIFSDSSKIAMLPQPFVTTAMEKNPSFRVALDLTEEWDEVQKDDEEKSAMITGVTVARRDFVKKNKEAVEGFLRKYQESVDYVNSHVKEAAKLVGEYEIVTEDVAEKALPECSIVYIDGEEMEEMLSGYLSVLEEQNPKSIGGELPRDDFYYKKEE